jgi:hypothetical protein
LHQSAGRPGIALVDSLGTREKKFADGLQPSPEFMANTNSQKYSLEALRLELLSLPPKCLQLQSISIHRPVRTS